MNREISTSSEFQEPAPGCLIELLAAAGISGTILTILWLAAPQRTAELISQLAEVIERTLPSL